VGRVQDHAIQDVFDAEMDGIEDVAVSTTRAMSIGDYRPQAMVRTFLNMDLRDGPRALRR
jgi:hypothetical protein